MIEGVDLNVVKNWHQLVAVRIDSLKAVLSGCTENMPSGKTAGRKYLNDEDGTFAKNFQNCNASDYALLVLDLHRNDSDLILRLNVSGVMDCCVLNVTALVQNPTLLASLVSKIYVFGLGAKDTVTKVVKELKLPSKIDVEECPNKYFKPR